MIYDTITTEVFDTTYVAVSDTLKIDVVFTDYAPPYDINTIKVYPNPAKDAITIQLDNRYTGDVNIQILDIRGGVQQRLTFVKHSAYYEETLDLTGVASGQYYILVDCGGRMYRARVVKI